MTGKEISRLMRRHHVTIDALHKRMGIMKKRIRHIRFHGLSDEFTVRDWLQGITGTDPGPVDVHGRPKGGAE